jgi:hypothetical protein
MSLNLAKFLAYLDSTGVLQLGFGIRKMGGITSQFHTKVGNK